MERVISGQANISPEGNVEDSSPTAVNSHEFRTSNNSVSSVFIPAFSDNVHLGSPASGAHAVSGRPGCILFTDLVLYGWRFPPFLFTETDEKLLFDIEVSNLYQVKFTVCSKKMSALLPCDR